FRTRTNGKRDICVRQHSSESTECRDSDYRIANPIRASHDNSFDTFRVHPGHYNSIRNPSSTPISGRQPNSLPMCVRSETYRKGAGTGSVASSWTIGSISLIALILLINSRKLTAFTGPPPRL